MNYDKLEDKVKEVYDYLNTNWFDVSAVLGAIVSSIVVFLLFYIPYLLVTL